MQKAEDTRTSKSKKSKKKKLIKRPIWMKIHTIISAFFLPAAMIFLITGALLPFHIRGSSETETVYMEFDDPVESSSQMMGVLENEFAKRSMTKVFGKLRTKKNSISWSDTNKRVNLKITDAGFSGELKISEYSFYQKLIRFHFAVSPAIKIFAICFSIAAGLIFFTGVVLAIQVPSLRKDTIVWTVIGFVFTAVLMFIS